MDAEPAACRPLVIALVALTCCTTTAAAKCQAADEPRQDLRPLVERIARGEGSAADEAAGELIQRVVGPLESALDSLEERPYQEQVRLAAALTRLAAVLRIRIARLDLPAEDRELLDRFVKQHRELAERLFDDDPRRRRATLRQLPQDPSSGVGVLIGLKLFDADGEVVEEALAQAGELKDAAVGRGLRHYVRAVTEHLQAERYGPEEQDAALVSAVFLVKAMTALAAAGDAAGLADMAPATDYVLASRYRRFVEPYLPQYADALGTLRGPDALAFELRFLEEPAVLRSLAIPGEGLLKQTFGDAMLVHALRLHGLAPHDFGFYETDPPQVLAGFLDERDRVAARRRFAQWLSEHAPASRPAADDASSRPAKE